jgi:hypothetical protein
VVFAAAMVHGAARTTQVTLADLEPAPQELLRHAREQLPLGRSELHLAELHRGPGLGERARGEESVRVRVAELQVGRGASLQRGLGLRLRLLGQLQIRLGLRQRRLRRIEVRARCRGGTRVR